MKLFGYYRSSASYRVRIALNLKGIEVDHEAVHLLKGHQLGPGFAVLNPMRLVPVLIDGCQLLTQSLAIIEYLEESHPEPALLPADPLGRARVRALAQMIACEIQPLNNLRVLKYLTGPMGLSEDAKKTWYCHWVAEGLTAVERMLTPEAGTSRFCHGDAPTLADICLVPQVYSAERFGCDLSAYPRIMKITETCRGIPAFADADPARQPDAE